MNKYRLEVDVTTVLTVEVEASDEAQATELAYQEAYEDTWGCNARYGGAKIYTIEEITGDENGKED